MKVTLALARRRPPEKKFATGKIDGLIFDFAGCSRRGTFRMRPWENNKRWEYFYFGGQVQATDKEAIIFTPYISKID